ncbi:hypothetical protein PS15m_000288 [Mucor circinelloides]
MMGHIHFGTYAFVSRLVSYLVDSKLEHKQNSMKLAARIRKATWTPSLNLRQTGRYKMNVVSLVFKSFTLGLKLEVA